MISMASYVRWSSRLFMRKSPDENEFPLGPAAFPSRNLIVLSCARFFSSFFFCYFRVCIIVEEETVCTGYMYIYSVLCG